MYYFRAQQGALVQRYKGQEIWLFYRLNFASLFRQTVIWKFAENSEDEGNDI